MALAGVPIIPVGEDKRPIYRLAPNGIDSESTDIDRWWAEDDWNYAFRPVHLGCVVLDLDLYKGVDQAVLDMLPATRTVRTPQGGEHRYYKLAAGEKFGNSKFAANVDVRCAGGYVLGPGSMVDGKLYEMIDNQPPVPLPGVVRDKLSSSIDKVSIKLEAPAGLVEDDDNPKLLAEGARRVAYHIGERGIGTEPRGDRAYSLANWLGDMRDGGKVLSCEKIIELMQAGGYGALADDLIDRRKIGERGHRELPQTASESFPEFAPPSYTSDWWLQRVLPPRVKLIGPLNTAARAMLFAATGVGKTHFAMAIAAAAASGTSIFGTTFWAAPTPARVLYIDGEMPLALLQERLREAVRRSGDISDGRLVLVSTADFRGVDALNTVAGLAWAEAQIKVARPDLVIFDNVQALVRGDQRDTEAWAGMQPWMRGLTDRGIAQLWVHHANQDGSMYGDKTRAWQLDTVISLKAVEAESGDLCFDLSFDPKLGGKARERHPGRNDAEYRAGQVKLQGNLWRFQDRAEILRDEVRAALAHGTQLTFTELYTALGLTKPTAYRNKKNGAYSQFLVDGTQDRYQLR